MKVADFKNKVSWDWMRPGKSTIQVDSNLEEAAARMQRLSIHHLIVLDGKKYVGLLDARDFLGVWDPTRTVREVMRSDVPLVDARTEVRQVVELLVQRNLTAVPLKRNGRVAGIITHSDLLKLLALELSHHQLSELVEKGKDFLANPIVQSLTRMLGNAGV